MTIDFNANENLTRIIQEWFERLKYRMAYNEIEYTPEDLFAVREGEYILVVANPVIVRYPIDVPDAPTIPNRRNLVKVVQEPKQSTYMITDSGKLIMDETGNRIEVRIDLLPIFRPDLIILLDSEGELIQDSVGRETLIPILVESEVKRIERLLGDLIVK